MEQRILAGADDLTQGWESPEAEVICLACEISAYAPDEDSPLF